jgi:hypothetical protein
MQDNDRPGALSAVRAFGVMAGGTFVPNLAAAVSVSSVARSVAHAADPASRQRSEPRQAASTLRPFDHGCAVGERPRM